MPTLPPPSVGPPFSPVTPSYSTPIQKSHNSLARGAEDTDYSQNLLIDPFSSATASSMVLPMFPSYTGFSHRYLDERTGAHTYVGVAASDASQPLMPTSLSFPPPDPFTTFNHSIYPTIVPNMQPLFRPAVAPHLLPPNDLSSTIEQTSTISVTHLPTGHLPGHWESPQPCTPSPPFTKPSRNSRVSLEARRGRPAHDASNSATDRRATSPRYSPYRRQQKKGPAVAFEPDVKKLQHRCKEAGAEEQAVLLIEKVFVPEVKLSSLTRKLTAKELASHQFGSESGQAYVGFLRAERDTRYTCRLCPRGTEMSWKHRRDVLRHLRRDHFGLAEKCSDWCVSSQ